MTEEEQRSVFVVCVCVCDCLVTYLRLAPICSFSPGVQTQPHQTPTKNQADLKKRFSTLGNCATSLPFLEPDEMICLSVKCRGGVCVSLAERLEVEGNS